MSENVGPAKRKTTRIYAIGMRGAAAFLVVLLTVALPARAQPAAPAAAPMEQRVASALRLCIADEADVAVLEAAAVAAGWPAFENLDGRDRDWRVATRREGRHVVESLGISAGSYPPAPVPATILSCRFVAPSASLDAVRRGIVAASGDENVNGFYYFENGVLRALTLLEMLAADFPAMIANIPEGQRLVIFTLESERRSVVAEVSVFERIE